MFSILPLAYTQTIANKRATPKLTLIYPLKELWSMVGASTNMISEIGMILHTSSPYDRDTWTVTNFMRLDTQGFTWM